MLGKLYDSTALQREVAPGRAPPSLQALHPARPAAHPTRLKQTSTRLRAKLYMLKRPARDLL
eukprot:6190312-Pleurochrysis_carterae.AAC.3